jgi:hypothetical protein
MKWLLMQGGLTSLDIYKKFVTTQPMEQNLVKMVFQK